MKQRFKLFGIYSIFWLVFFVIARLLFLFYENSVSFDLGFKEWILTFAYGFRMDLSSTGYIMGIVGVVFTLTTFANGVWLNRILKSITIIFLVLLSSIVVADLELYNNWGFRMDSTPLLYITKPKEAMASTELWLSFLLLVSTVGLIILGVYSYNRFIRPVALEIVKSKFYAPLAFLLLTGSMILPVRGGVGIAPMNTGMVYFSENKFANHAAINVAWNVVNSLVHKKDNGRSIKFMDEEKAQNLFTSLNSVSEENTLKVLKTERPNVVLLILESFSSKVVGAVGGKWDATPKLNQLAKEGLLFNNFYANGDRSDKGLVCILSGFPAQPRTSIMKTPEKTESLPSLFDNFNKIGYKTSFYYGGDIDFANMRSYFFNAKASEIFSDKNFDSKFVDSKWGVHDEHLFDRLYNDLTSETDPFFTAAFTLSSHDPFEVPMDDVFEGSDRATKFMNSVYYTDSCLGRFFERIKETEVWDNTLFILVADHGSQRPGKSQNHELDKFRIPMLWLGGALKDSLTEYNYVGSQIDIPATLLHQLSINSDDYSYSKDLFNSSSKKYGYYVFNDGFAFITDSTSLIYDNTGKRLLFSEGDVENDLVKAKAIIQTVSYDYLHR
jgi:phosphoglycerol transferase MdoB-like AlkP superfamily enzyme